MGKITLIIIILTVLASCFGNKKQNTESAENLPLQSSKVIEQVISDGHNARNSLDFHGVYRGTLPTASGSGVDVVVELKDSTYVRTTVYLEAKDDKKVEEGVYTWNDAGSIVTLQGATPANQYFVAENMLFALDLEGNRIEGDLADQFILRKE